MREIERGGGWCLVSFLGLLVMGFGSAPMAGAQSGELGNVCIRDFSDNASCTATDVEASALEVIEVLEACDEGEVGVARVVLDVTLFASVERYDVGLFIGLEGGSALDGPSCYHDFLPPPLTTEPLYGDDNANLVPDLRNGPWANLEPFVSGDSCGDIAAGTEVIKSLATELLPIAIACVDTNQDGSIDASICVSWRSGNQGVCGGLSDATASSSAQCSCARIEVLALPEPTLPLLLMAGSMTIVGLSRIGRDPR